MDTIEKIKQFKDRLSWNVKFKMFAEIGICYFFRKFKSKINEAIKNKFWSERIFTIYESAKEIPEIWNLWFLRRLILLFCWFISMDNAYSCRFDKLLRVYIKNIDKKKMRL